MENLSLSEFRNRLNAAKSGDFFYAVGYASYGRGVPHSETRAWFDGQLIFAHQGDNTWAVGYVPSGTWGKPHQSSPAGISFTITKEQFMYHRGQDERIEAKISGLEGITFSFKSKGILFG